MTKAVLYEKRDGSGVLSLHRYFGTGNYIKAFLTNAAFGFAAYLCILFLVIAGDHYLDADGIELVDRGALFFIIAAVIGIVFSLCYAWAVCSYLRRKYANVRSSMREYDLNIRKIDELESEEEEGKEV